MKRIAFFLLALGAALLPLAGAPTARGCMATIPTSTFCGPLQGEVLGMPEPCFQRELSRLLHQPVAARKAVGYRDRAPEEEDRPTSAPRQLDQDVNELEAALKAAATSATQARALVAGYRAMRLAMDQAGQAKKPFDAAPFQGLMTALPWEFVLYTQGAVAWQNDNTTQAVEAWRTLLTLPEKERHYRSAWAAYMIGRALREDQPKQAVAAFEECRRLAAAGFADVLHLASASLGWQARVELKAGQYREAINHYVQQGLVRDGAFDTLSLKTVCSALLERGGGIPAEIARDPVCRAVLSAYFLAGDGETRQGADAWFRSVSAAGGALAPEEAEDLAWLAYNRGNIALARQWLARSPQPGAIGRWLRAKLMLREGQIEPAIAELEALRRLFPRDEIWDVRGVDVVETVAPCRAVCNELAALYTGQEKFVAALDAAVGGGRWQDIAYLAERVVTSAELAAYLDAHQDNPDFKQLIQLPWVEGPVGAGLDHLLARRLLREGRYELARRYFERGAPGLLKDVDDFIRNLKLAAGPGLSDRARAWGLYQAGLLARRMGMELLGTELAPDWSISLGDFTDEDPAACRITGNVPRYLRDEPSENKTAPPPAPALSALLAVKPAEKERAETSAATPYLRFHYRYQAADLMWAGAQMLPNNDPLLARMLWQGGRFISDRAPSAGEKFYRALVVRCPGLPAGQQADRLRALPGKAPELTTAPLTAVVRVAPAGDDRNDGSSWRHPKRTLQAAIAEARLTSGNVWAAAGVYRETIRLAENVAVYGGFRGNETTLEARTLSPDFASIIDAGANDGSGASPAIASSPHSPVAQSPSLPVSSAGRPAEHAVILEDLTSATLDGFTIRGGDARGAGEGSCGGGLFARNVGPGVGISRCLILQNRAACKGAGVYLENASPQLIRCTIANNLSADSGGGLACVRNSRPRLAGCVIAANGANFGRGGGLFAESAGFELAQSWLSGNWSGAQNGGGACLMASRGSFMNCFITGNSAGRFGGGAFADEASSLTLTACTVAENKARSGGGAWFSGDATGLILNCIFAKNEGCAITEMRCDPESDHWRTRHGALAAVSHCFFSDNSPAHYRLQGTGSYEFSKKTHGLFKTAAEVSAGVPGGGNRGGDPRFAVKSAACKGKWTRTPSYDPLSNTTTLYDKDSDFRDIPGRVMLVRPDKHRRTVGLIAAVRDAHTLEVLGDWRRLTARGRQYRLLDYRLQDGSGALGGGQMLAGLAADIDGQPRRGRIDLGAAQAPAGFKPAPDHTAPASKVERLPKVCTSATLAIRFACRDEESGVRQVQLFYRKNEGPWQPAAVAVSTTRLAASGLIRFDASKSGEGDYEFYTLATDAAGNTEAPPKQPDTRTLITSGLADAATLRKTPPPAGLPGTAAPIINHR